MFELQRNRFSARAPAASARGRRGGGGQDGSAENVSLKEMTTGCGTNIYVERRCLRNELLAKTSTRDFLNLNARDVTLRTLPRRQAQVRWILKRETSLHSPPKLSDDARHANS